jgi:hypothetical protein
MFPETADAFGQLIPIELIVKQVQFLPSQIGSGWRVASRASGSTAEANFPQSLANQIGF